MNFNANAFRSGRIEKKIGHTVQMEARKIRWRPGVLIHYTVYRVSRCELEFFYICIFTTWYTSIPTEFSL